MKIQEATCLTQKIIWKLQSVSTSYFLASWNRCFSLGKMLSFRRRHQSSSLENFCQMVSHGFPKIFYYLLIYHDAFWKCSKVIKQPYSILREFILVLSYSFLRSNQEVWLSLLWLHKANLLLFSLMTMFKLDMTDNTQIFLHKKLSKGFDSASLNPIQLHILGTSLAPFIQVTSIWRYLSIYQSICLSLYLHTHTE